LSIGSLLRIYFEIEWNSFAALLVRAWLMMVAWSSLTTRMVLLIQRFSTLHLLWRKSSVKCCTTLVYLPLNYHVFVLHCVLSYSELRLWFGISISTLCSKLLESWDYDLVFLIMMCTYLSFPLNLIRLDRIHKYMIFLVFHKYMIFLVFHKECQLSGLKICLVCELK